MKIGIPRALLYYRYGLLWETFFQELGHTPVVSPPTNKDILLRGEQLSIDENCLSAKLFFGHAAMLEGKCDALFVPRIANLGPAGRFQQGTRPGDQVIRGGASDDLVHRDPDDLRSDHIRQGGDGGTEHAQQEIAPAALQEMPDKPAPAGAGGRLFFG